MCKFVFDGDLDGDLYFVCSDEPIIEKLKPKLTEFVVDQRIEGNFHQAGNWYPGVITRLHRNGKVDILYKVILLNVKIIKIFFL